MRVLLVNDYRERGGAEVLVAVTARLLRERGHEVDLFTGDEVPGRRTPVTYIDSRPARRALRSRLEAFAPDVVHLHNFYHELSPGILQAVRDRRGSPSVLMTAHDCHLLCPSAGMTFHAGGVPHLADPARLHLMSYLLSRRWDARSPAHSWLKLLQHVWNYRIRDRARRLDRILCPSRFLRDLLAQRGLPALHLPHPVRSDLHHAPTREASAAAGDELRIIFAGRIEPEKGLREFLTAMPSGFRGTITIVGEGSQRPVLEKLVRDRGFEHRVRFTGRLPHEAAIREIAAHQVLALPSVCFENSPLVLAEALALGVNILASDQPATREIAIESGAGFLFDPRSPESLGLAIGDMQRQHERGRLNAFDAQAFLARRTEHAYINGLLAAYRGSSAVPDSGRPDARS